MSNLKNIVKVMNFHALLRVDHARRKVALFQTTEENLTHMIAKIINNKNLILDKKSLQFDASKKPFHIYIGNDYGFCGNFNAIILKELEQHPTADKIIIGKKLFGTQDQNILLKLTKEEFYQSFSTIEKLIRQVVEEKNYSEVVVFYNHYYNAQLLGFRSHKIFPIEFTEEESYQEDFAVETDLDQMIKRLCALYICYEIRICEMNSWAAENVMREQITNESIQKMEEREEEEKKQARKQSQQQSFKRLIENARRED